VRFTRHAKSRAREIGATIVDTERLVAAPESIELGRNGKWAYIGHIRGERVRVVVALDDPELIVTIHRRRR
jgi:hypothetical protein